MSNDTKTDFWAIVEVMGHRRFAGRVTEQVIGGQSFVRIDVPECGPDRPPFSKLFGSGAIYCISPVTEDLAKAAASRAYEAPVSEYDLPAEWREKIHAKALVGPAEDESDYGDPHDDEEEF